MHVDVASPRQPFRKCGGNARNLLHDALDLGRDAIDLLQLGASHFDPHGTLDTCGQHVDAVANRWYPDVGKPRHLDRAIELLDQLVRCHPGPPFLTRLELDRGLEHLQRGRIGCCLCPSGLGKHARHFGDRLDQSIGLLQKLGHLSRGNPGQR